jgi:basic amino acid/polyamine antiporter, APA family
MGPYGERADVGSSAAGSPAPGELVRGVSLTGATALNMIDMIGVGPFITMPLIVSAMGGPQAILGWVLGALFAACDGLVWAELGAALPGAGGSYRYLAEAYGPRSLGRLMSFLFVWQLSFSAPLSIASGALGLAGYAAYLWPSLEHTIAATDLALPLPLIGPFELHAQLTRGTFVAVAVVVVAVALLYRRVAVVGRMSTVLWIVVMGTIAWIIISGLAHFDAARAFSFPPGAFTLSHGFFAGLASAMLIATYDYWGYYNVCFLGGEIRDPGRTIPRALLLSILLVGVLYVVMNVSILGVLPWQELVHAAHAHAGLYTISLFMERIHGPWATRLVTVLVLWTAFASVFALLLGYSRVPYAAATDGNYFRAFAHVHRRHRIPDVSLLALGAAAAGCCVLSLADVIAALVVIRIMLQFLFQAIGVIVLRIRRPDLPRPFRMWLYPVPAVLASVGFVFVALERRDALREVRYAAVILVVGLAIYLLRAARMREWPFGRAAEGSRS